MAIEANEGGRVSTRKEKTKRIFLSADGTPSPRARLDSVAARIVFVENGYQINFKYEDLKPEVARAAALYGIMTSATNTVGRADMTIDDMIEAAEDRINTILGGLWSAETQSGPGHSDLLAALERFVVAAGKTWDPAPYVALLKDEDKSEEARKKWLKNDHVKAHLAAIKSEKAAARLKKAQEALAASGPDASSVDDLLA